MIGIFHLICTTFMITQLNQSRMLKILKLDCSSNTNCVASFDFPGQILPKIALHSWLVCSRISTSIYRDMEHFGNIWIFWIVLLNFPLVLRFGSYCCPLVSLVVFCFVVSLLPVLLSLMSSFWFCCLVGTYCCHFGSRVCLFNASFVPIVVFLSDVVELQYCPSVCMLSEVTRTFQLNIKQPLLSAFVNHICNAYLSPFVLLVPFSTVVSTMYTKQEVHA